MRPLKLTLTAFGPYQDQEIIDFQKLQPYDLFVISGNTGAGKTSIFDGISYALFGSASGEDRKDPASLRSDFASDSEPTSAELIFSLRDKTYRIYRQLPYTKAGNKSQTPGKAEIYEIDLENDDLFSEINIVDRQIPTEVDRKVSELIGLNSAQFNQLVMLPQGEYQRFLTSSTNNKEAILRTVFNTEKYQKLTEQLKAKRDLQNEKVTRLNAKEQHLLHSLFTQLPVRDSLLFSYLSEDDSEKNAENSAEQNASKREISEAVSINAHQALTALEAEAEFYFAKTQETEAEITAKTALSKTLQMQIAQGEAINDDFTKLSMIQQQLKNHLTEETTIQTEKIRLDQAERAQPIEKYHDAVIRLRTEAKEASSKHQVTTKKLEEHQALAKKAEVKYAEEVAKEPLKLALQTEIIQLESNQAQVESLASLKQALAGIQAQQQDAEKAQLAQKTRFKALQKTRDILQDNLKVLEKEALPAFALTQLQQALQEVVRSLKTENDLKARIEVLQEKSKTEKHQAEEAQATFQEAYQHWLSNQSQLLAENLQKGEPCPVCGSKDHPALHLQKEVSHQESSQESTQIAGNHENSSDHNDHTDRNDDFTELQQSYLQQEAQYQNTLSQITQVLADLQKHEPMMQSAISVLQNYLNSEEAKLISTVASLSMPAFLQFCENPSLPEAQALLAEVENAQMHANQQSQKANKARTELHTKDSAIETERKALDSLQTSLQEIEKNLILKTADITRITESIPEELQDIAEFRANLQQKQTAFTAMKLAFESAKTTLDTEMRAVAVLESQEKQEKLTLEKLIHAGMEARKTLDCELIKAGFIKKSEHNAGNHEHENGSENKNELIADEASFTASKLEASLIKALRETIQDFEKLQDSFNQQIAILQEKLTDKTPVDLANLKTSLEQVEATLIALNDAKSQAKHLYDFAKSSQNQIEDNAKNLEKERDYLQKVIEVHDLLKGDNAHKLSFERYILIEYFEQVIEAANLRLQKMTNGQFEFTRSESLASHGKQSGLDLDIYDAYTGEARDVKTLSGGEKFKASLSLSLGMADIIQAHQGGISIGMMFIDEGFGSLDEESLQQALDVLIDLQASGRMIGIISHVEELKQKLPARIEVTKTAGGFSKTKLMTQDL
ncbi:AAA family ATPase [Ignatzschineria sp. LJL83]